MKGIDGTLFHGYRFSEDFYNNNEAVFFMLINNTKKGNQEDGFLKVMEEVFGQKPNISNLQVFFRHEAVQALWNLFLSSERLDQLVSSFNALEMKKL